MLIAMKFIRAHVHYQTYVHNMLDLDKVNPSASAKMNRYEGSHKFLLQATESEEKIERQDTNLKNKKRAEIALPFPNKGKLTPV
ncbi:hypothetical protein FHC49_17325 [Kluyvera sp. EC_51]|uniref:hypothetical protein n=1 Tax=Kluyvera sp. EC_51 TaxID=2584089 RepID=UPI001C7066D4|nr:hypothetical protein [Kluyvera sp. EC_51]MBW9463090.1 hypothetical protein [Kluyvera sp. EC_51]